jgi:arsenite methyltransferase
MNKPESMRSVVQRAYGEIASQAIQTCCDPASGCCGGTAYTVEDHPLPESDLGLSCGNPVAFTELQNGDVVLDLGSGAGKDVFLAARRVGVTGRAIGVDMTPQMLDLARHNSQQFASIYGLSNTEFREGFVEHLPLEDASVDVVISNCVINLSLDKPEVFREIFRVLRPGGRMIVSDIVLNRALPQEALHSDQLYAACISGALPREDYLGAITAAGFPATEVLDDHQYDASGACCDPVTSGIAAELQGCASSMTIKAVKPRASPVPAIAG